MCMRLCAYLSTHPKDAVCTYVCVCVCADSAAKLHFTDPVNEKYNSDCIPDVACTLCFQSVFQWWYAAKRLLTHIVLIQIMCVLMCVRNSKTLRKIYLDTIMRPQEGCTFNQVNIWHITPARLPVSRSAKQKAGVFVSIVRDRLCPQDQIWMKQILIKAQKRSFVFHQYNDPYMLLLFYEWNSQRSSYTCVSAFVCAYERQVQKVPIMRQSAKWSILQICVYVCTCVCLWGAPEVSNISRHAKLNILQIREVEGA